MENIHSSRITTARFEIPPTSEEGNYLYIKTTGTKPAIDVCGAVLFLINKNEVDVNIIVQASANKVDWATMQTNSWVGKGLSGFDSGGTSTTALFVVKARGSKAILVVPPDVSTLGQLYARYIRIGLQKNGSNLQPTEPVLATMVQFQIPDGEPLEFDTLLR